MEKTFGYPPVPREKKYFGRTIVEMGSLSLLRWISASDDIMVFLKPGVRRDGEDGPPLATGTLPFVQ